LIANGAALATAVAFLKDKGPKIEGVYALNSSAWGLTFGGVALCIPWLFADYHLENKLKVSEKRYHNRNCHDARRSSKNMHAYAGRKSGGLTGLH
jgi:hypothetical protein